MTLVATARAADAAGAPSLPQETVAQFSLRESLGGPSTVLARDPSTLVAALAGRTFSRASLHRALDAWLDVPTDPADDAVLVFSSPLSPPALPSIPPSVFSEPAPRHSDIRPSRAQEGVTMGDLSEWSTALGASVELAASIRAARSSPLAEKETLENSFRLGYARMPRRMERVAAGASRLGVDAPRMLDRAAEMLAHYESAVEPLIHSHAVDEPSLAELTDLCAAHASSLGARVSATVVLTGLRADLGETFGSGVIQTLPGARVVAQGLRWTVPGLARARPRPRRGHRPHALGRRPAPAAGAPGGPRGLPRLGLRQGPPGLRATSRRGRVAGRGLARGHAAKLALGVERTGRAALRLGRRCRRRRRPRGARAGRWLRVRADPPVVDRHRRRRGVTSMRDGGDGPRELRLLYLGLPLGALYLQRDGFTLAACGISRPDAPGMWRLRTTLQGAPLLERPNLDRKDVIARLRETHADVVVSWFWTRRIPRARSSTSRPTAGSTCTPRCSRATAARTRTSGPCAAATRSPGSPCTGSTSSTTPVRSCCSAR